MRALLLAPLAPLILLAACQGEPENIQARAENQMHALEERHGQIQNEAENEVSAQTAPLDVEAEALLNRIAGNAADNGAVNAQ